VCVCVCCGVFSQVFAEAVLKTLDLMSKLRGQVKDMETSFYRMLQVRPRTPQRNTHTICFSLKGQADFQLKHCNTV
jgi:hypothetical protein